MTGLFGWRQGRLEFDVRAQDDSKFGVVWIMVAVTVALGTFPDKTEVEGQGEIVFFEWVFFADGHFLTDEVTVVK